jgi:uncharacterized phage protein (TIGR01671 family)
MPKNVGQFMGLKNKEGVEIFKEDIVKGIVSLEYCRVDHESAVRYDSEYCCFTTPSIYDGYVKQPSEEYCNFLHQFDTETIEIIGNIHQNSKLINS